MTKQPNPELQGMLLVLHVPFRQKEGRLLFELQACNGLERWADNFGSVTIAAPLLPEELVETENLKTLVWQDTAALAQPERFQFVPLPRAYTIPTFLKQYAAVRSQLANLISQHRYLQFGLGSLVGDWAAVAALEAHQQGRDYAIHADWVEHEVALRNTERAKLKTRLKALMMARLIETSHQWIIERCQLGLWHGADCYSAYSRFCPNSFSIHNIHTKSTDLISKEALLDKVQHCTTDPVLRICYVGRMAEMKAPIDWVKAIGRARDLGVNLQATWIGDGVLRSEMEAAIQSFGLSDCIELTGLEADRRKVLSQIRAAHLMMFTHVTPESPRCLIEALVNGTPIVGYSSQYPDELTQQHGGGAFVPMGDWQKLGNLLSVLANDRPYLAEMTEQAAKSGSQFTDEAVFYERSQLIKKYLQRSQLAKLPQPADDREVCLPTRR